MSNWDYAYLDSGSSSILFGWTDGRVPTVLHWGASLGSWHRGLGDIVRLASTPEVPHSAYDEPVAPTILAQASDGWPGTEAVVMTAGRARLAAFTLHAVDRRPDAVTFEMEADGASITAYYRMTPAGVLAASLAVTAGADGAQLYSASLLLPVPDRARQVLDFTGRWSNERVPQTRTLAFGPTVRRASRGRVGHDSPFVTALGTPGFRWQQGEIWACHVAWGGDTDNVTDRMPDGAGAAAAMVGGGEAIAREGVALLPGDSYTSPTVYFAYGAGGLNSISAAFHRMIRARPGHPASPRPVDYNSWEATYFDLDPDRLMAVADRAAALGVERFVIDDGWFRGRRSDTAGLGDWYIDDDVWHGRMREVTDHIRALGMKPGLWFEPEMVNPDSDLARRHPDWLVDSHADGGLWRHQHPLDMTRADVRDYLHERIIAVVHDLGIEFIKWDYNRDVPLALDADRHTLGGNQIRGLYALLDAVRRSCPGVEIESCASGGARVDLATLDFTERVWASDCNDPLDRQRIQRWTSLLLPPELIGAHVGPAVAHTTGRTASLEFRMITATFAHAGLELNISELGDRQRASIASWVQLYQRLRGLLHSGDTVVADVEDGSYLHGVRSADGRHALYAWVRLDTTVGSSSTAVPIPGLDPTADYRVTVPLIARMPGRGAVTDAPWLARCLRGEAVTIPGAILHTVGLAMPRLGPQCAVLIEMTAVSMEPVSSG